MVISDKRREMFVDLYRLAEYFEAPPFLPGDADRNADWFVHAVEDELMPFTRKHTKPLAWELANAVLNDADRKAKTANDQRSLL